MNVKWFQSALSGYQRSACCMGMSFVLAAQACVSIEAKAQESNGDGEPMVQSASTTEPVSQKNIAAETLSSIVVTARRGEEKAKDVPFGLTVVNGEEIDTRRLQDLEAILRIVPGVDVNSSGGVDEPNVRIRGVGSLYSASRDDNSVVLNIDGVSMSSRNLSLGSFDIERVEVLKGPQGTLFGRSSEAGVINVTTHKPTRHLEGYVRGEIGQDHQYMAEAVVSGPLSDNLSGRIAMRQNGSDHWVENARNGDPVSEPRDMAFRGSLMWDAGSDTSALLTAERYMTDEHVNLFVSRPFGDNPSVDLPAGTFNPNQSTTSRYSLEINHDLADSRLTSITGATTADTTVMQVFDTRLNAAYGMNAFGEIYPVRDEQDEVVLSQELRLSSLQEADIFWVTGVHLDHLDRSHDSADLLFNTNSLRDISTNSAGVFGEITYPLVDELKVTAGLRHSWEHKEYDADYISSAGAVTKDSREMSDNYTTGRIGLTYGITPDTNLYGMLSRGYKSASFNDFATNVAGNDPYKAAVARSIEIGFKAAPENLPFALNGAVFLNRVQNDHLLNFDALTNATSVVNADTQSKGAELEGSWSFDNGFTVSSSVSYIRAEIKTNVSNASGGPVVAGNGVPDVPNWSGNVAVDYYKDLPQFWGLSSPALNARLDYRFVGERPADVQNHFEQDSYGKLDMHLGIMIGSGEFYLWGSNLLDDQYSLYGFGDSTSMPGTLISYGAPARGRNIGLGFNYSF